MDNNANINGFVRDQSRGNRLNIGEVMLLAPELLSHFWKNNPEVLFTGFRGGGIYALLSFAGQLNLYFDWWAGAAVRFHLSFRVILF